MALDIIVVSGHAHPQTMLFGVVIAVVSLAGPQVVTFDVV